MIKICEAMIVSVFPDPLIDILYPSHTMSIVGARKHSYRFDVALRLFFLLGFKVRLGAFRGITCCILAIPTHAVIDELGYAIPFHHDLLYLLRVEDSHPEEEHQLSVESFIVRKVRLARLARFCLRGLIFWVSGSRDQYGLARGSNRTHGRLDGVAAIQKDLPPAAFEILLSSRLVRKLFLFSLIFCAITVHEDSHQTPEGV